MLASLADAPLVDPRLVYEPKYDGIRAIAEIAGEGRVRLWSRLGNEKTAQFPEIAAALGRWSRARSFSGILDGEIVALDARGDPAGFQNLQGRIHLTGERALSQSSQPLAPSANKAAFIAFDVLQDGPADLREKALVERRARLERLFRSKADLEAVQTGSLMVRLSEQVRGDGRALYARALGSGWEGLIAKWADSSYK
jgi:bifunctional non-homologous end joining protein LigD